MTFLYSKGSASDFPSTTSSYSRAETRQFKQTVAAVLKKRGLNRAAGLLFEVPFEIIQCDIPFSDYNFSALHATLPLDLYELIRQHSLSQEDLRAYAQIANVFTEVATYIRFIAVSLDTKVPPVPDNGLKEQQIKRLVYRYIGVSAGYLGDFTYRSHAEFYTDLDLDINPNAYSGTTRERFIEILKSHDPDIRPKFFAASSSDFQSAPPTHVLRSFSKRFRGG